MATLLMGCAPARQTFEGQGKMQDLQMEPGTVLDAKCNDCSLRIRGDFRELWVDGKDNFLTLEGRVNRLHLSGAHNVVECLDGPERVYLKGSGQHVRISERPGRQRPQIEVEGNDQAVTYRPWQQPTSEKASSPAAEASGETGPRDR